MWCMHVLFLHFQTQKTLLWIIILSKIMNSCEHLLHTLYLSHNSLFHTIPFLNAFQPLSTKIIKLKCHMNLVGNTPYSQIVLLYNGKSRYKHNHKCNFEDKVLLRLIRMLIYLLACVQISFRNGLNSSLIVFLFWIILYFV